MMAENKKSFVAYADWKNVFDMLEDDEAGRLVKHLFSYVNDENPVLDDRILKMAFEPIKLQLKRDLEKYEMVRERRAEAGRVGGKRSGEIRKQSEANEANASSVKQSEANEAVTDNGNDTVTVTVTEIVTVTDTDKEKQGRFKPPSLLEVQNYITEKKYTSVNANSFWNFYESKNWFVGKNKMKDWKKAIAGWESRNNEKNGKNQEQGTGAGFTVNR